MLAICLTLIRHTWPAVFITAGTLAGCGSDHSQLRKQGVEAFQVNDLPRAGQCFRQAVDQDPTDWQSLFYLGRVQAQQGRWLESQLSLEKAFELHHHGTQTADMLDALADVLSRRRRMTQVNALIEKAIQDYGGSRDYGRKGRHLQRLGDIDGAKLAYRKAAFFAPKGDARPFLSLADFYESISDTDSAVTALRHAYTVNSGDPNVNDRLRRYGIVPGPTAGITPENAQQ